MAWSEQRVQEFTRRPLLAVLATVTPRGAPQAVPVWYDYDGTHFRVVTAPHLSKAKNIRRDSRVTLVVIDTSYHNYNKLVVRGRAEVVADSAQEVVAAHVRRYLKPQEVPAAIEKYRRQDLVVIKIKPERYL